jgi:hypothetical protein
VEYLELVDLEVVDLAEYFNSTFLKSKKLSSAEVIKERLVAFL